MMEYENTSVKTITNSGSGGAGVDAPPSTGPPPQIPVKKKRNLPGTPDPEAEVIALSPKTLLATNRFVCEICNKGFQRDQNLQLHRRGHNLPWKLRQRTGKEVRKRVYVCPEPSCIHHDPSRALGDLTGIKKHFCRKHGEKKWKCDKCSKKYAVQSDWKAHSKVCGTREYRCDCGTIFSRRDSFITHRAFCDALAEERAKTGTAIPTMNAKPEVDDGKVTESRKAKVVVAAAMETASAAAVETASPLDQQDPEKSTGLLHHVPPPSSTLANTSGAAASSASATTSSNSGSSSSNNTSMFASLFASVSAATASHCSATFSDLMGAMAGHSDRPLGEPPSLCLATNAGFPSLFAPHGRSHDRHPFAPSPASSHMSATALLQKAAQMGAVATGSSFLRGFGLDASSGQQEISIARDSTLQWGHQRQQLLEPEPEPVPMMSAGLGLGLPYEEHLMMGSSSLYGAKPATLDFLGLGMRPVGGGPNGELSALLSSSIGGSRLDIGPGAAVAGGREGTERKSTNPANP
ncbi:zinc finger protein GAI-ASSOCIATED FACTOR 1-like [Curcuma longa]|uniref:zinc finger protein GAI-ASSOCIATED FACTOR 1-like n=1 Tax=Curcuma longa TaxID=136217 RepID=UPI003D9E213A